MPGGRENAAIQGGVQGASAGAAFGPYGAAIGGIGGAALGYLSGGGGSSASNKLEPASWKDLGAGTLPRGMWEQWIANFYGGTDPALQDNIKDLEGTRKNLVQKRQSLEAQNGKEIKQPYTFTGKDGIPTTKYRTVVADNTEEIARIDDQIANIDGQIAHIKTQQETPSFEDRLAEDVAYQETEAGKWDAAQDITDKLFTDTTGGITDAYTTELNNFSDKLTSAEKQYMQPLTLLKIAGQPISAIPKRNMMAMDQARGNVGTLANLAGSRYNAGLGQATNAYNVGTSGNTRDYNIANEFTPNKPYFQYMDTTWPILAQMQGWRFGMPSETASVTYRPDLLQSMGEGLQMGGAASNWLQSLQQNQAQPQQIPSEAWRQPLTPQQQRMGV